MRYGRTTDRPSCLRAHGLCSVNTAIASHLAREDRLAAYFEARPFHVVTHDELVSEVGENYRSRISPLRKRRGMVIENVPTFKADGSRGYGSYIFRPDALGRDASDTWTAQPQALPLYDGPAGAFQR